MNHNQAPIGSTGGRKVGRVKASSLVAVLAAVVGLSACGGADPVESAESLIESELAEQLSLGSLDATCEAPAAEAEGEQFACTATTEGGDVVGFDAVFTSDDEINVVSNNVLLAEDIAALVGATVDSINTEQPGAGITVEDVTCPNAPLFLIDGAFECQLSDAIAGLTYPLTIDTGGLTNGQPAGLSWEIGNALS